MTARTTRTIPVIWLMRFKRLILNLSRNIFTILTTMVHQMKAPVMMKTIPQMFSKKVVSSVTKENLAKRAMKRKMTSGLVMVKQKEVTKSCT